MILFTSQNNKPSKKGIDEDVESRRRAEDQLKILPGSLFHKACFALFWMAFYVCLVLAVAYIPQYTLEGLSEIHRRDFDGMWWSLVRTTVLVDIFSLFCFPKTYSTRPLPTVLNGAGAVAILVHFVVAVARAYYYSTLGAPDFLVYVSASIVIFVLLTFRQFYVSCFSIFTFEPFLRNKDLLRDYNLKGTTGSVAVISTGAFEIVLKNEGTEVWYGKNHNVIRITKHGYRNRSKVSFSIPENVVLRPKESIKLIPETQPLSPGTVHIRGWQCFGYDSEDFVITKIIRNRSSVAKTLEKYRETGKVWSDSGKLAADFVKQDKWTTIVMSTFDDSGRRENQTTIL